MYLLILMALNIHNPDDIPGRVELTLPSRTICQQALDSIQYQLKFRNFRVEGRCEPKKDTDSN